MNTSQSLEGGNFIGMKLLEEGQRKGYDYSYIS